MIPYKLRLRNFMCYREEQMLDFSGIHLACLTGENGHGKSALLDAMTWALWGRARARRDDELIALGESDMWVDFEFGLGKQRFRVLRLRSKKGRGQSDLHLYVWHAANGGEWQLLDDGNLNDRQQQIIRTLRLDYDTFVNSAFLLQGRADSFTTKTPAERKQVLADILGLSRYDQYEQRARELAQVRKERALVIENDLRNLDADLSRRPQYEEQLRAAQQAVAVASEHLRLAEKEHADARLVVEQLRGKAQQLGSLKQRMVRAERDLADVRSEAAAAQSRLNGFEGVLVHRAEIEAGWRALEDARKADVAWNERLRQHTQLQGQQVETQHFIDRDRLELEAEQRRLAERDAELMRRASAAAQHSKALSEAQAGLAKFAELQAQRDLGLIEIREVGEKAAALKVELGRITTEGKVASNKVAVLQSADEAACPLCGQPLTADHRDRMAADLLNEHDALQDQYRTGNATLKALEERRKVLEQEDRRLTDELRKEAGLQKRLAVAEAGLTEAQHAGEERGAVALELDAVAMRLTAEEYAQQARSALTEIVSRIAEVGYNSAAHNGLQAEITRFASFDGRYQRQLLPALEGVDEARTRAAALAEQAARREADLAEDQAQRQHLEIAAQDLPRHEAILQRAAAAVDAVAQNERRARQQEGGALQQLAALDALVQRGEQLRALRDTVNTEFGVYNELREAFGKKGIQAMIIESAIPEVEIEANRLLSRMSEGRMSVRLETQREKVTGGMAETLDIIIADELGSRAYETFSGGETFRANLALRIAISKLLARRAGAQLQTMVIDEGFGSQDATGRSLVVEAINSIQHDFERILVITHIDELKDLFPARIDVVKTPSGSRVSIA